MSHLRREPVAAFSLSDEAGDLDVWRYQSMELTDAAAPGPENRMDPPILPKADRL